MRFSPTPKALLFVVLWASGLLLECLGLESTFNPKLHHCISWTSIASQSKPHPSRPTSAYSGGSVASGAMLTAATDGTNTGSPPSPATASIASAASASASSFSTQIAGVYPVIQSWINDPAPAKASNAVDEIKKTIPAASDIIDSLGGRSSTGPPATRNTLKE